MTRPTNSKRGRQIGKVFANKDGEKVECIQTLLRHFEEGNNELQ